MNAPLKIDTVHGARRRVRSSGEPTKFRWTLSDYYKVSQAGILDRFGRTELINGEIIALDALHLPHATLHKRLFKALDASVDKLGGTFELLGEVTAELDALNGPLPDLTVVDWDAVPDRTKGIPLAALRLVVEIGDSSYRRDLGKKRKLYAKHGIPEYWVAVIPKRTIERFAHPDDGDYRDHARFDFGDAVESLTLPGVGLHAGALLA